MPYELLQGGRQRRRGRRRFGPRRRGPRGLTILAVAALAALLLVAATRGHDGDRPPGQGTTAASVPRVDTHPARYASVPVPAAERVHVGLRPVPYAGLLFDIDSGRVLWSRSPRRVLPIASLTKMMTALLVVAHSPPGDRVLITRQALNYAGSGVGVLPLGKRVPLEALLYGMLLPSGNDAAIALAQHVGGTVSAFVARMNARARELGLRCTRFSSPDGFLNGNHSCARDVAVIAREVLSVPRLASIVRSPVRVAPFPIKGGRLFVYNNNPLVLQRYPGITGVKTGYTVAAGRCLVASAQHGDTRLAVVLLHSADPATQARKLLNRGFGAVRRAQAG